MKDVPEQHPLHSLFRRLTDRAFTQSSLSDRDLLQYLTDLLVAFAATDRLYRLKDQDGNTMVYLIDMLEEAQQAVETRHRRRCYQHIGDYSLFILGMFPESLSYGRRSIPESYYVDTGRRSYLAASHLEPDDRANVVFKKLADKYERCVLSLGWVREYTSDPFYQYMLREYGVL